MPYDRDNYPHRNYGTPNRRFTPGVFLSVFEEDEINSHPNGGDATKEAKDLKAFRALNNAGRLVDGVAGWAIDHQTGLAAEGLSFVPLQPSGTNQHREYLDALRAVDDHRHELAGGKINRTFDRKPEMADPIMARLLLINLLRANSGGFPHWLVTMTIEALEALAFGEVMPLLVKSGHGRKRDQTALRLQLRALTFIHYRVSQRFTEQRARVSEQRARAAVALALGVSDDTLRTWKTRVRKEFGALAFDREMSFAENAASHSGGDDAEMMRHSDVIYGNVALQSLGQQYKAALRRVKAHKLRRKLPARRK